MIGNPELDQKVWVPAYARMTVAARVTKEEGDGKSEDSAN
jgi:hypothetical protein